MIFLLDVAKRNTLTITGGVCLEILKSHLFTILARFLVDPMKV